jgi:predicted lipoprotein with Yx(FWY)xxD motif
MSISLRRALPLVAAAVLLTACSQAGGASPSPTSAASGSPAVALTIEVAQTSVGASLTGDGGRTLYEFTPDTGSTSTCTGSCAGLWPPLTVPAGSTPSAGSGVQANLFGTTQRADGSSQVTYNGHPLYYYSGDTAAGDVNGQGLNGKWYIANPDGSAPAAPAASASASSGIGY